MINPGIINNKCMKVHFSRRVLSGSLLEFKAIILLM